METSNIVRSAKDLPLTEFAKYLLSKQRMKNQGLGGAMHTPDPIVANVNTDVSFSLRATKTNNE